jgi:hypothetical protein
VQLIILDEASKLSASEAVAVELNAFDALDVGEVGEGLEGGIGKGEELHVLELLQVRLVVLGQLTVQLLLVEHE